MTRIFLFALILVFGPCSYAQKVKVKLVKEPGQDKINVIMGGKFFTAFLYPDSLEKPVLYPILTAEGTTITRGFPVNPKAGEPTDHPHHLGLWFNFENVNGLDFWNNSYAIPADKKAGYGWIKTDRILETTGGDKGILSYHANWVNQKQEVLLEEKTRFEFSGNGHRRIIDRTTVLTAATEVLFKDAKDGMLGLRLAQELQMPTKEDQKFKDDKGNETLVKAGQPSVANGNYISSQGKKGDDVWSSRGKWVKVFAKMNNDSVSVAIIDHPGNPNYPTYWHARGYGLFAANPLGEQVFTNGKRTTNLHLQKGQSVTFKYRIVVEEGKNSLSPAGLEDLADDFAKKES